MKTRIALVNGIWQLCMVTAGMWQERSQHPGSEYQDFLVVYTRKTGNFELADFVLKQCQNFWNWKSAIAIEWSPGSWNAEERQRSQSSISPILNALGLAYSAQVDELWLCKLQFLDERLFADLFSSAQLVLYEDGLHTYAPAQYLLNLPKIQLDAPKKSCLTSLFWMQQLVSGELNWMTGVKRSHLSRVKTFYSVLGQQLEVSEPFRQVPTEYFQPELLQQVFSHLYHTLNCNFYQDKPDRKVALFLGSNLSHLSSFPKEAEVNVFAEAMQQARDQGYMILWKEHPRSRHPLLPDITDQISSDHIIALTAEQKFPIELLLANGNIALCCSTLSSSLFYLRSIYGTQTATCVKPLLPYLSRDFLALSELTLAKIGETL
ncbi:alpha-2,8-polysialyltransferase family protein [Leptolyngbya sp. AN03gr2]|uniref:alpha-2,8-polysialyltransferase family protein n=1 Tax=unclassified Leptolyngbya TaxID=2650499 RepID=UPI003D321FB7